MTRRCKDCLITTGNKKVKELAETLSYAHTAFLIVQKEKILLEQKLEKIKEICKECNKHEFCPSTCKFFDNCSGISTELILKLIEGAEDDD